MNLRVLRSFVEIADCGSIRSAAARLGVAQPPLSQQLRALETELGAKLFERHAKGVVLTEPGRLLLREARSLLTRADAISECVRRAASGLRGTLSIAIDVATGLHPLPLESVRQFRQASPEVDVGLREGDTETLARDVATGRVDVAFVRALAASPGAVDTIHLADEPLLAALPSGHRLADRDGILLRDLAGEALSLLDRDVSPVFFDQLIEAFRGVGLAPSIAQRSRNFLSCLGFSAANVGIAVVPASVRLTAPATVVLRPILDALKVSLFLVLRHGDRSETVLRFKNLAVGLSNGEAFEIERAKHQAERQRSGMAEGDDA